MKLILITRGWDGYLCNMDKNKRSGQRGMTLIELMISASVMVTVLGACIYLLHSAHYLSQESRNRLLALNAARSTLEAVKNTGLANVPNINTAQYVPAALPSGTITITTNPAAASLSTAAIATVTIDVRWTSAKNIQKTLQITTMRSRY